MQPFYVFFSGFGSDKSMPSITIVLKQFVHLHAMIATRIHVVHMVEK